MKNRQKKTAKIYPEDHKEIMKEIAGTPVTMADYIKMLREELAGLREITMRNLPIERVEKEV